MGLRNSLTSYGIVAKFLHWLLFILVSAIIALGYLRGDLPEEYKATAINLHKLLGVIILFLMVLRALWALTNPKPYPLGNASYLARIIERVVHGLLYLSLFLMPLSGWIGSVAAGKPPRIGERVFSLPLDPDKSLVKLAFFIHNNLALILIGLIILHTLAALYHHFIRKDDILRRMLP
jgi:cytochrome b561